MLSIQGNEIVVCVYIYGNVLQHLVKPLPSFTRKKSTICNNIIQHPDLVFNVQHMNAVYENSGQAILLGRVAPFLGT